jgi:hypothetical protein
MATDHGISENEEREERREGVSTVVVGGWVVESS